MRKNLKICGISLIFFIISSIIAYLLKYMKLINPIVPLLVGFGILIFSGILAFVAKKLYFLNIVCFILNSIALGLCIRAWYIYRNFDNNIWIMLLVSLVSSLYILIFYLYSRIPIFDRHPVLMTLLFFVISIVAYILLVIYTKTTFLSTYGYYMIVEISFLFASFSSENSNEELFRKLSPTVVGILYFVYSFLNSHR